MQAIEVPLYPALINKLTLYINRNKYEYLLFSFILLIFGNTFTGRFHTIAVADVYQNFVTGLIIFYNKKWLRNFILCIILLTIALDVFATSLAFVNVKSLHGVLYLMFFTLVAKEVYKEVLYTKTVSRELLSAALCGFVLLCLMATFLFYLINIEVPHSFSNTGEGRDALPNLNYFSFTTLLTIGYGDITPLTLAAKRAVMLIGLAGHFYTVFITSIIIGKYLSAKKTEDFN